MVDVWIIIAGLGIYPLAVLGIAVTGPHSEIERRANEAEKRHG